jgi:hypothetical protein
MIRLLLNNSGFVCRTEGLTTLLAKLSSGLGFELFSSVLFLRNYPYKIWMFCEIWCCHQGRTNLGRQVTVATKSCVVAPNICGSSVWNLLQVPLLTPRILRLLLRFWKICAPLFLTAVFSDHDFFFVVTPVRVTQEMLPGVLVLS